MRQKHSGPNIHTESGGIGEMANLWVLIPSIIALGTFTAGLYFGLEEHAWDAAFPYLLLSAFAAGLAGGAFLLFGRKRA